MPAIYMLICFFQINDYITLKVKRVVSVQNKYIYLYLIFNAAGDTDIIFMQNSHPEKKQKYVKKMHAVSAFPLTTKHGCLDIIFTFIRLHFR